MCCITSGVLLLLHGKMWVSRRTCGAGSGAHMGVAAVDTSCRASCHSHSCHLIRQPNSDPACLLCYYLAVKHGLPQVPGVSAALLACRNCCVLLTGCLLYKAPTTHALTLNRKHSVNQASGAERCQLLLMLQKLWTNSCSFSPHCQHEAVPLPAAAPATQHC
jgi:hypothetical protein